MTHKYVPDSSIVNTPQALAAAMVRAARGAHGATWLDPCVGDGAFVTHVAELGVERERFFAVDIFPGAREVDCLAQTTRGVDFIDWARQRPNSIDHVVMNPPYVALSRLRGGPFERAREVTLADGKRLPLKANYWCAFLLRAIGCLRAGGSLVAVLPAAWDFAKYAVRVRDSVAHAFGEVVVVRCASPLFPDVLEGAVVVACFQRGFQPCRIRRIEVNNLDETISALEHVAEGRAIRGSSVVRSLPAIDPAHVRLDQLVDIRIGAVTGDANYFLLSEHERTARRIPRSAVCPVLSRSKHLSAAIMDKRAWASLRDAGGRVWLFRPQRAALKHPAVRRYLRHGKQGACNIHAFKVSSRTPWHRTPVPEKVDAFFSGMSKRLPFLVLSTMEGLTATNTLYVVRFRKRASVAEKATLGLLMLTSQVRRELARHARVYADGLLKFEPTELGSTCIPIVASRRDAPRMLKTATLLLLAGREQEASALADAWVASIKTPSDLAQDGQRILPQQVALGA